MTIEYAAPVATCSLIIGFKKAFKNTGVTNARTYCMPGVARRAERREDFFPACMATRSFAQKPEDTTGGRSVELLSEAPQLLYVESPTQWYVGPTMHCTTNRACAFTQDVVFVWRPYRTKVR